MRYLKLLGIFIFAYILWQLNWQQVGQVLRHIRWPLFLVAIIFSWLLFLTKASRWYFLLQKQGITYSYRQAVTAYLCGLYLAFITPGRLGDMIKAVYLKKEAEVPLASGFANVLFDRLLDIFSLLIMGSLALTYFFYSFLKIWSFLIPLGIFLGLIVVFLNRRLGELLLHLVFHKLEIATQHSESVELSFARFHEGLGKLLPHTFPAALLTLLAHVFFHTAGYLIALSLNIQIALLPFVFTVALSMFSSFFPFAGLGARETIFITIFAQLGLSKEQAISYTTLSLVVFNLLFGFGGFIVWELKRNLELHQS